MRATILVIATRAVFIAVASSAAWLLASPDRADVLALWDGWDAGILMQIAEHGYTSAASDPHATAFFPLFPLIVAALSVPGIPPVAAGMIVSLGGSIVACAFLYLLAEEEIGRGMGRRAGLYLLLFPTSVFLIAPYSESLFLAGAIPAFYYARRGRWLMASLPAAVAVGTRLAGLFLVAGLVAEYLHRRRGRALHAAWALGIALLPLALYMAYLWVVKDDPLYFLTDQRLGWGRTFPENPITAFERTWNTGSGDYPPNWIFAWRIEILAVVLGTIGTALLALRREWGYTAYAGTAMAALMASSWYFSVPRVLLTLFPFVLLLASASRSRSGVHEAVLIVLGPLAALGVVVFTQGHWFF